MTRKQKAALRAYFFLNLESKNLNIDLFIYRIQEWPNLINH